MTIRASTTVARIRRDDRSAFHLRLESYDAGAVLDLRLFTAFAGPSKALAPTKTGLTLPLECIDELIHALIASKIEAIELGLIGGAK